MIPHHHQSADSVLPGPVSCTSWTGRRSALGRVLVALALAAFATTLVAAAKTPSTKRLGKWHRVDTTRFTMFSNMSPRKTSEIAEHVDGFATSIELLLPQLHQARPKPTFVYVLGSDRAFEKFSPFSSRSGVAGYFAGFPDANHAVINASLRDPYRILYHEYMHYVLAENFPFMPAWLNEGLASYLETFRFTDEGMEFGRPPPGLLHVARYDPWIPLEKVLGSAPIERESDVRKYYAESWLLVHYLLTDENDRAERTKRFFALLSPGQSSKAALTAAFELDVEDLQKTLQKYSWNRKFAYKTFSPAEELSRIERRVRPMGRVESLVALGRLLRRGSADNQDRAIAYFDEVLRLEPGNLDALTGKADIYRAQDEDEKAIGLLERVIQADPGAAYARYLLGSTLINTYEREHGYPSRRPEATPEQILRARRELKLCLEEDPLLHSAYNQLAHTYLYEAGSVQPAIEMATAVLERMPDLILGITLSELHYRAGDDEAARAVMAEKVEKLLNSGGGEHSPLRGRVEAALQRAELVWAMTRLDQGQPDEALAILRELLERVEDEELREEIGEAIAGIEDPESVRDPETTEERVESDSPREPVDTPPTPFP